LRKSLAASFVEAAQCRKGNSGTGLHEADLIRPDEKGEIRGSPRIARAGPRRVIRVQATNFAKAAKFAPVPELRGLVQMRMERFSREATNLAKAARFAPVPELRELQAGVAAVHSQRNASIGSIRAARLAGR
jgi:hypothetical protein